MGQLTTHVLDTSLGKPASGIKIELFLNVTQPQKICEATTNSDGRVDEPLLSDDEFNAGSYLLKFHAGDYFKSHTSSSDFLDEIVISFNVASPDEHYHVPLLLSPYGYSTYRGS